MARKAKISDFNPFCHGTSSIFLDKIRKEGLKPRGEREHNWGIESFPDRVYLGSTYGITLPKCDDAAEEAAEKFGGKKVILQVRLPSTFTKYAVADEDFSDEYLEEAIEACEGEGFSKEACSKRDNAWLLSLLQEGSIAVKTTIPPKYIKAKG